LHKPKKNYLLGLTLKGHYTQNNRGSAFYGMLRKESEKFSNKLKPASGKDNHS